MMISKKLAIHLSFVLAILLSSLVTLVSPQAVAVAAAPNQPVNISPANGAPGISLTPTLQSSAFADPDVGDTHAASQWQITTISDNYDNPVFAKYGDSTNLTSIFIPSDNLSYSTPSYWHVRYQDNHAEWSEWSDWSVETSFVTAGAYPRWDINEDRVIDYKDLAILGAHYGEAY